MDKRAEWDTSNPDLKVEFSPEKTAFLLVDCDVENANDDIAKNQIYSSLLWLGNWD